MATPERTTAQPSRLTQRSPVHLRITQSHLCPQHHQRSPTHINSTEGHLSPKTHTEVTYSPQNPLKRPPDPKSHPKPLAHKTTQSCCTRVAQHLGFFSPSLLSLPSSHPCTVLAHRVLQASVLNILTPRTDHVSPWGLVTISGSSSLMVCPGGFILHLAGVSTKHLPSCSGLVASTRSLSALLCLMLWGLSYAEASPTQTLAAPTWVPGQRDSWRKPVAK